MKDINLLVQSSSSNLENPSAENMFSLAHSMYPITCSGANADDDDCKYHSNKVIDRKICDALIYHIIL